VSVNRDPFWLIHEDASLYGGMFSHFKFDSFDKAVVAAKREAQVSRRIVYVLKAECAFEAEVGPVTRKDY